jgi:copper homeostasis protein CutC
MLEDIGLFKSTGIAGVVLGALNPDGTVDVPRTRMWVFVSAFIIICSEAMTGWWKLRFLCRVRKILREPCEPMIEHPITVCFHRAFDMTRSAVEGMSIAICHNRSRIDGSGAFVPAFDQICTIPNVTRILTRWITSH